MAGLVEQQLADIDGNRIRLRANALMMLQRRELLRAGDELAGELGKPFVEARAGESIKGRLVRQVDLVSGRFALIENSRKFTLVLWRPVLDRQVGRAISGIVHDDGVSWRLATSAPGRRFRDGSRFPHECLYSVASLASYEPTPFQRYVSCDPLPVINNALSAPPNRTLVQVPLFGCRRCAISR